MRLVFLRSQTEFGVDGEEFAAVIGDQREEHSREWEFHGGRPLAIGPSRVSGPPQWGQLSSGSGSVVFRSWGFSLLEVAESRCLAFCNS